MTKLVNPVNTRDFVNLVFESKESQNSILQAAKQSFASLESPSYECLLHSLCVVKQMVYHTTDKYAPDEITTALSLVSAFENIAHAFSLEFDELRETVEIRNRKESSQQKIIVSLREEVAALTSVNDLQSQLIAAQKEEIKQVSKGGSNE